MTIGQLARAAGVGVETIRFYQREGLLVEPPKPPSGYRRYEPEVVERLHFIQRAKTLGFTLAEIRELLELGDGCCDRTQELAEHKLALVHAKQRDLAAMAAALEQALAACAANPDTAACPLIQTLCGDDSSDG
jgi:MerR family mercuric resistance operon transcriptional regulator